MNIENLRMLVCGYSQTEYPRDETIMAALRQLHLKQLYDLRVTDDRWLRRHSGRKAVRGRRYKMALKTSWVAMKVKSLILSGQVDAVFVMKRNEEFVLQVCRWARQAGIPVVYDLWVSWYLIARRDQQDIENRFNTEKTIIQQCNHLLALTGPYRNYYTETFQCPAEKISVLPLAVEDIWLNHPLSSRPANSEKLVIAYWGNVHKQHGVDNIREAARMLTGQPGIEFKFYGSVKLKNLYKDFTGIPNVEFHEFLSGRSDLINAVDNADICCGHLNPIHDSHLVLPNKALEGMARGKVVLHADSETLSPLYHGGDGSSCAVMFFTNGAKGLAEAILKLYNSKELRRTIGDNAREKVIADHSVARVGKALQTALEKIIS